MNISMRVFLLFPYCIPVRYMYALCFKPNATDFVLIPARKSLLKVGVNTLIQIYAVLEKYVC